MQEKLEILKKISTFFYFLAKIPLDQDPESRIRNSYLDLDPY